MLARRFAFSAVLGGILHACARPAPGGTLAVAAASNLGPCMEELNRAFRAAAGNPASVSLGSTSQLARQIEQGAPFDVFLAAERPAAEALWQKGLAAAPPLVFASGQLVLWSPARKIEVLRELRDPGFRSIAVAKPELAPYGRAAMEALTRAGLLETVQPRLVFAQSAAMARQFAATGNADAAFVPLSLVLKDSGSILRLPAEPAVPLDQAAVPLRSSSRLLAARRYVAFLREPAAQRIFERSGYLPQR